MNWLREITDLWFCDEDQDLNSGDWTWLGPFPTASPGLWGTAQTDLGQGDCPLRFAPLPKSKEPTERRDERNHFVDLPRPGL